MIYQTLMSTAPHQLRPWSQDSMSPVDFQTTPSARSQRFCKAARPFEHLQSSPKQLHSVTHLMQN